MNHYVNFRTRIEKDIVTRLIRTLRGTGSFNVKIGQQVTPEEIIGSSKISAGFRNINLSRELSVIPKEAEKYLTKGLGQKIYKDELLALKKDWLGRKKVVTAPTDGILEFLNTSTGELKIAFLPKKVDLPAGVYGIVEAINPEKGQAVIKAQVSRIYGIFGSGRSREGILRIISNKDELADRALIQARHAGQVLVAGSSFFKDTISAAISQGVSGMITGGINAADYKSIAGGRLVFPKKLDTDIGISVLICEGFGSLPIGDDIFQALQEFEGKFVFIDGNRAILNLPSNQSSSLVKVKNTSLPPLQDVNGQVAIKKIELIIGIKVRVLGNTYAAEQGKVIAIDKSLTLLPSGIKAYLATIETKRRRIQVPVASLEAIM